MTSRSIRRITIALATAAACAHGPWLRASAPQAIGTWTSIGVISDIPSGAATVALADGRTLIAGGAVAGGSPTDRVAIYDPSTHTLSSAGQMVAARTGHTATLLDDHRLLIAGGSVGGFTSSDIEIFDLDSGTSTLAGLLVQPRTGHAAARLADGTVLIVGGTTVGGLALHSAEVAGAEGNARPVNGSLQHPRAGASATTLIDGRVLVAGGNDGTTDLATAEIFDPYSGTFTAADSQLSAPRSGHAALLLPHNNSVLITGGTSGDAAVGSSDLFLPAEFPDPYTYGTGWFAPIGAMANARTRHVTGPHLEGYAFVGGGGPAESEAYRFPTIKTDKDDYEPGELATITGSGWRPGEAVTLLFQEDPAVHEDYVLTTMARTDGTIYVDQWSPEAHDLGVRFYLMAKQGALRAQTTFMDGNPTVNTPSANPFSPNQASSAGVKDSTTFSVTNNGSPTAGVKVRIRAGTSVTGALIFTFDIGNMASSAMSAPLVWDGKDSDGAFVPDGTYTIRPSDPSGESDSNSRKQTIIVDNTNPTVSLLLPANGATVGNLFKLKVDPIDLGGNDGNIDKVEFYLDGAAAPFFTDSSQGAGGWETADLNPASLSNGSHTWFAKAYDEAGNNSASGTRTFAVGAADGIAPTTTLALDPAGPNGTNGWYTVDVHVTVAATDNTGGTGVAETRCVVDPPAAPASFSALPAGCAFLSAGSPVTTDGMHIVYAASRDGAGNMETVKSAAFKVDKTAPTAVVNADRAPDHNGWYNAAFTGTWTGTDAGSLIADCTTTTYSGPDAAAGVLAGTCTDNAGNISASVAFNFQYDATAPVDVAAAADRAPDFGGWFNHALTVTWSGNDATSLIASCTTTVYSGPDSGAGVTGGSCVDNAGNRSGTVNFSLRYDGTAPMITIAAPTAGGTYVLNQSATSQYGCGDATSGVASCAGTVANGAQFSTNAVGPQSFSVNALDQAGNPASATRNYSVAYAPAGTSCLDSPGHSILQPIELSGTSVFKQKSTVPAKFRVCDANGQSIGTANVVTQFRLAQVIAGTTSEAVNEPVDSTTPDTSFRWSATDQQWIFNINTKTHVAGRTYVYLITLNDLSTIQFQFGLK
jgi:hypothetical protein